MSGAVAPHFEVNPLDRPFSDTGALRGEDTLRVVEGTVVGLHGQDVFVELGPRAQGVITATAFGLEAPQLGQVFEFTLRGREEGLWVLSLPGTRVEPTWEELEVGSLVAGRVTGVNPGGLELKVGHLHGFMPRSETGLGRREKPRVLLGQTFLCEVIEVSDDTQRVTLSRRRVLQAERANGRPVSSLRPGETVHGRVTRIEKFGAFVTLGSGAVGLVHVSDLSHERLDHPSEVVRMGETLEVRVLAIRRGGKRISLGLKQLQKSPWDDLDKRHAAGDTRIGLVTRLADYGVFLQLEPGVIGLLHISEFGTEDERRPSDLFELKAAVAVRIVAIDSVRQRITLSRVDSAGRLLELDAVLEGSLPEELGGVGDAGALAQNLGHLVRRALSPPDYSRPSEDSSG